MIAKNSVHIYSLCFYSRVNLEAAVNWILVKAKKCSVLKFVKKILREQIYLLFGCYCLCSWA